MKERLQQLWPNIKFAWRCMGDSWKTFGETEEVRALRRAFRVFWWRLGDVFALIGRLIWAWFLNTRMVRSARAWWQRTKKAVWELPQYQFLRRFSHKMREHLWMRWLLVGAIALLVCLPWCVTDTTAKTYTYLVVTDEATTLVDGYPDFTYESDALRVRDDTGGDAQFILTAGQQVLIRHGDELLTVESYNETVQNLLERYDIQVGADEMIGVNTTGLKTLIHVSDELRCRRRETTVDTYKTKVLYDYLLPYGEHVILQEGTPGLTTDTYDDVYRSGEMVNTVLVDRSDSTAKAQIVVYGRLVKSVEQDDRIERDVPYGGGSPGHVQRRLSGVPVRLQHDLLQQDHLQLHRLLQRRRERRSVDYRHRTRGRAGHRRRRPQDLPLSLPHVHSVLWYGTGGGHRRHEGQRHRRVVPQLFRLRFLGPPQRDRLAAGLIK